MNEMIEERDEEEWKKMGEEEMIDEWKKTGEEDEESI